MRKTHRNGIFYPEKPNLNTRKIEKSFKKCSKNLSKFPHSISQTIIDKKNPKTQTKSHELFTQLNHFPFNPVFIPSSLEFPHHKKNT